MSQSQTHPAIRPLSYRPDLDGLRALAVLSVVAAHAGLPFFEGGFVGVDVFFVLSGYLITSIMARDIELQRFSYRTFYERRARRLLPALFFMLAIVSTAGFWFYPPWQYDYFAETMAATAVFSSNIQLMFATGDYFSARAEVQPLLHTWSLAVEEQFYFFFPPLLLLAYRYGRKGAILAVSVMCLVSFSAAAMTVFTEQHHAFFLPHLRAWEMGLGALLALTTWPKFESTSRASSAGLVGLAIILSCIFLYDKSTTFPGIAALPVVLGTVLLIHCGGTSEAVSTWILSRKPVVAIGRISYSLYLWHWPPIVAVYTYFSEEPGPIPIAAAVAFSFIAAWLSWRFIEAPFRGSAEATKISGRAIFRASAIGTSLLLIAAMGISLTNGVATRLPDEARVAFSQAKRMSDVDRICRTATVSNANSFCRLGHKGPEVRPSVLVWGDSHAGAWLPGADLWMLGQEMAGTAFIRSGCPPLIGLERIGTAEGASCREWNDAVIDWIDKSDIETVILIGRWTISYHGSRFGNEPGSPAKVKLQSDANVEIWGAKAVESALDATLKALTSANKEVIVIGNVPEIGWNVPQRYLDVTFFSKSEDLLIPEVVEVAKRIEPVDTMLHRKTTEYGGHFYPVYQYFCNDSCLISTEEGLLYRDDDHLSELGGKLMFPLVMSTGD